jgi:hypothetical protein
MLCSTDRNFGIIFNCCSDIHMLFNIKQYQSIKDVAIHNLVVCSLVKQTEKSLSSVRKYYVC